MPATKSTTSLATATTIAPPGAKKTRALRARDGNRRTVAVAGAARAKPAQDHDVIVLSSDTEDDEDDARAAKVPLKRKKKAATDENTPNRTAGSAGSSKGVSRTGSIVEVSIPRSESSALAHLRSEHEKLKQELSSEKRTRVALQAELAESKAHRSKGKSVDLVSELEDCTTCEICIKRMWSPATLVECGHTFCQTCLRDWFDSTFTKHIQQHPEYIAGPQIPAHLLAQRQHLVARQAIQMIEERFRLAVPQPQYNCPTCRMAVKMKPVEVFGLKEVVEKVAKAAGEEVEEVPAQNRAARADIGGIWDGFFKNYQQ